MSPLLFRRLSDESLGSRLASGEAAAFDELYRRYVHRLAAYASHLLGDPAAGDDVAQSTLLKAYGALRDGRVPDKMRPWLFRIAHNTAIDLVVRRRELPSDEVPELAARDTEPFAGALVAALAALPERQRRVYVLRELHGMRIAETAGELGLTSTQVEQALFAARNRLAELLVFGDRLDCATVQRLGAGPLDAEERRALKTHLRSCPACRKASGLRGRALGWLPGPSLEWLRGLLVGGAAPAAAKVGAVVATATIAGSVPLAAQHAVATPRPARTHLRVQRVAAVRAPRAAVRPVAFHAAPAVVAVRPAAVPVHRHETREVEAHRTHVAEPEHHSGGGDDGHVTTTETTETTPVLEAASREGGDGGGEAPAAVAVVSTGGHDGSGGAIAAPAPTTTTSDGGGGGNGSSSGLDGGSGGVDGGSSGPDGSGGGSGGD